MSLKRELSNYEVNANTSKKEKSSSSQCQVLNPIHEINLNIEAHAEDSDQAFLSSALEVAAIKEAEFLYREVKNSLDMVLDQLIMLERNNLLDQIKAARMKIPMLKRNFLYSASRNAQRRFNVLIMESIPSTGLQVKKIQGHIDEGHVQEASLLDEIRAVCSQVRELRLELLNLNASINL